MILIEPVGIEIAQILAMLKQMSQILIEPVGIEMSLS